MRKTTNDNPVISTMRPGDKVISADGKLTGCLVSCLPYCDTYGYKMWLLQFPGSRFPDIVSTLRLMPVEAAPNTYKMI